MNRTSTSLSYPLRWPHDWERTAPDQRSRATFGKWSSTGMKPLTVSAAVERIDAVVDLMDDLMGFEVCTDLPPQRGRSALAQEPEDTGAVAYWETWDGEPRCIAIDQYDRVADNLAAIAATLNAIRSVERHGGVEVMKRVFTGFAALPRTDGAKPWYEVFGCRSDEGTEKVQALYRKFRSQHHPDRGGDSARFAELQEAWDNFRAVRGIA